MDSRIDNPANLVPLVCENMRACTGIAFGESDLEQNQQRRLRDIERPLSASLNIIYQNVTNEKGNAIARTRSRASSLEGMNPTLRTQMP